MDTLWPIHPDEHTTHPDGHTALPTEHAGGEEPAHHYLLRIVAAIVCAMMALVAVSPLLLAFVGPSRARTAAMSVPPPRSGVPQPRVPAQIYIVVTGGMPGWQITLVAAGAAVLAAVLAVAVDRARTARRHLTAPTV